MIPVSHKRGYTLLELIVSVGVFSVVMLAATAAYLALIDLDRKARATADVVTNLSFAVDSMAREIRTGKTYKCNNNPTNPNCGFNGDPNPAGSSFGFTDGRPTPRDVVYSVNAQNQLVVSINSATPVALTDPRVRIDALRFYVRGVGLGAQAAVQPEVLFVLSGFINATPDESVAFSIQSSASQRLLELSAP